MLKRSLCGATLLLAANVCSADIITQNFSVATQNTNFSEEITFDLFDSLGGALILESVTFSLNGIVNGTAEAENLNANSTNINATLSADMSISSDFNGELVSLEPTASASALLDSFDGVVDYSGASGTTLLNLNANQFDQVMLTDLASLAAYTGIGTSTLDFLVMAASYVTGGGNIDSKIFTEAGGNISVVYTYTDLSTVEVDEPAMLALLGLGLLGLGRLSKRTK